MLDRAQRLMPEAMPRPMRGDLLLTLMLWKMWSDQFRLAAQTGQPTPAIPAVFPAACLFEACDLSGSTYPGDAIAASLIALCHAQAQPGLRAILRPERFAASDRFAPLFQHGPIWPKVMDAIGAMPPIATTDSGTVFSHAVAHLGMADTPTPQPVAALMARLLQPWSTASVYVPACGHGELLLATLADLERRNIGPLALQLRGQEADPGAWAISCMQLLARQIPCDAILCGDVLAAPLHLADCGMVMLNDIVLGDLSEQPILWQHDYAAKEGLHRFPPNPPSDGRLGQVWHMLASLRPGGRMALLMPPALLTDHSSFALRHTLLKQNWVDAVVTLPHSRMRQRHSPPRLLIITKRRAGNTVAFIHPAPARPINPQGHPFPYDNLAVWVAFRRFERGQVHADLHIRTRSALLRQLANLDITTLLPGIAAAGSATASGAEVPVGTVTAAA
jgi:hypothetical protein